MGKHSAPKEPLGPRRRSATRAASRGAKAGRTASASRIDRLEPASTSAESPVQHNRRRERPDFGERQRRAKKRKRVALGCLSVFVIVLLLAGVAGAYWIWDINRRVKKDMVAPDGDAVKVLKENAVAKDAPFYMIIMGVDNREGETRARSDTLIVARVDPPRERVTLVSIPRDTRVRIPGHGTQKINAANALGGPSLVIETVQDFIGVPISHYVEIDFKGFKDVVDALGGVTVNVPEKIQDPKAGNYDPTAYTIYAGEQKLTGAQALTLVRSRNFPRGDLQRIENQQLFIKALLKQTLRVANAFRLPGIVNAVATNVTTDLEVGQLLSLAKQMNGMSGDGLEAVTMPGTPKYIGGVSYVIADEEALTATFERIESGRPASSATSADGSPTAESTSVTIRNGAGVGGVALDASNRLRRAGFDVGEVGNMNQFMYDETLVVYKKSKDEAELVAATLGKGKVVSSRGMYSFDTDVLLVVGKDWGPPLRTHVNQIPK